MVLTCLSVITIVCFMNLDIVASRCTRIKDNSCLLSEIRYNWTSLPQFIKCHNQTQVKQKLENWLEFQIASTCWQTLAPFLCHTHIPVCNSGTVFLPCKSICHEVRSVCGVVPAFYKGKWPRIFDCNLYETKQCIQVQSLKNQSLECRYPLVKTTSKKNWYSGIQGCGLRCKNQFYTNDESAQIQTIIAVLGSLSMFCNLFSVATFFIDWKAQSKYPAKIIFYMNLCFCLSSCGWLVQFLGETRNKIICKKDGTKRIGEPGNESGYGWCLFSFILIYYFAFAGIMWFVMLSYAWHNSFRTLGSTKDQLSGKTTYFHVFSWMIPVISTITILIMEEVDADPVAGICFVGIQSHGMRRGFVLVPFGICLIIGEVFMIRGTIILFKVKGQNLTFLNGRASTKIKETIIRISFFSILSCLFFIVVLVSHVHESSNWEIWEQSLLEFVRCEASKTFLNKPQKCEMKVKPSMVLMQIQMIAVFGTGITVSTWSWTKATLKTWKKAWIRFRGFDVRKRIQNSFNARRNRRKINPMVEQAFPAIAMAVPMATKAAKRGSIVSIQSQRRGSVMRISSFVSGIADEILSRLKTRSAANSKNNENELCNSPMYIRPKDGRRRSLLSIESLLTTSSQGKLRLRRGSLQASATSGSEFGMAFGHMWSIQPQLNVPIKTGRNETSKNLRVIRLGEDLQSTAVHEIKNGKKHSEGKIGKKRNRRRSKRINASYDASSDSISITSSVLNSNREQRSLPPLKTEWSGRSPCRWLESRDTTTNSCHSNNKNNKSTENDRLTSLKFFHETFIGPSPNEKNTDKSRDEKKTKEKERNRRGDKK